MAYVFLHLLPELTEGIERLREVLGEAVRNSPLRGLGIFLVALVGCALLLVCATVAAESAGEAEDRSEAHGSVA